MMRKNVGVGVLFLGLSIAFGTTAQADTWQVSKTYDDVVAFMHQIEAKYPKARKFELGISDSGKMIEGVQVGDGPVHNLVVGTHHGNEYGNTEVAKGFIASLAAQPIAGMEVTVIPVLNISGYNAREREETGADGTSYDPNRNYPGPCGTEGPFTLKSTALLAKFIDEHQIVASATLHTFYPAVVYPWGISTQDTSTPYDSTYRSLVQAAVVESGYATGNSTEVIYPADGCYEDYAYWKHGIWSLLFELGYSHSPSDSEVANMIKVNVPGLRRFLAQAPTARAPKHDFTGHCDSALRSRDRHDE
ncbi:MAG TPA: M14 family zinc carboxypeptidase [Bdellovibrionota bacterium]|nr:M14 family zinc carboxypeptidase [Bdellovibrionota bacterium]